MNELEELKSKLKTLNEIGFIKNPESLDSQNYNDITFMHHQEIKREVIKWSIEFEKYKNYRPYSRVKDKPLKALKIWCVIPNEEDDYYSVDSSNVLVDWIKYFFDIEEDEKGN